MSLSINKVSIIKEEQATEKTQSDKRVHFRAITNNTAEEDSFEKTTKKKKAAKIVGWSLALAIIIAAAIFHKKGKMLGNSGKKLSEEISENAGNDLSRPLKNGPEGLADKGRRAGGEASDIATTRPTDSTGVEPPSTAKPIEPETPVTNVEPTVKPTETEPPLTEIPPVTPIKVEPRIFTEAEVRDALNARLDRTVPIIPEELRTIKIKHPEFKANFKEIFGMDLNKIESIPLDKYMHNGNFKYEEILPDGRKLIVTRLNDSPDVIQGIDISLPNEDGMYIKECWVGFEKSKIIMGDMTKHTTYNYGDNGLIRSVLVGRESLGTYAYDAEGKLFRILEEENTRMMTQRRIYFDPQTGKIKEIQYFDTTRQGWEGMKADYFDKDGKFLREIFSDDALRIARKKEEINEILKLDKIIPDIPKELETTTLNEQELKMYFEKLGISIEEIENIPLNSYKQIIEPGKTSERRYVKDLLNGKKLIICRNKKNYDEIAYVLIESPKGVESKVIFAKDQYVLLDVSKFQYPWCIYRDSGELSAVHLLDPKFGYLSYNAEGKLTFAVIENPETKISRDIHFNADTGKVEDILYKGKVDGVKSDYLKQEFFNEKGEITAEYFPEEL